MYNICYCSIIILLMYYNNRSIRLISNFRLNYLKDTAALVKVNINYCLNRSTIAYIYLNHSDLYVEYFDTMSTNIFIYLFILIFLDNQNVTPAVKVLKLRICLIVNRKWFVEPILPQSQSWETNFDDINRWKQLQMKRCFNAALKISGREFILL